MTRSRGWRWPPLAVAIAIAIAVTSGVVWALCFGREALAVAPWVALVPFFLLLGRGRPALTGLLFGLGYWLVAIPWIRPTLATYGELPDWLASLGLLAAAGYLSLYGAAFAVLAARIRRRKPWLAVTGPAAVWVALETLRGIGPLAFPWNLAAYSVVETPGVLALTAWIGSWGLSFLVVAVNMALTWTIEHRDWRPAAVTMASTAALVGLAALTAGTARSTPSGASPDAGPRILLLQPNSPITAEVDPEVARTTYARLIAQADEACDEDGPALLVWPESAAWPFSYQRHGQLRRDVGELARRGCPVLLNSTVREGEAAYNSVYLVSGGGADQRYDKELLVPFGETVPFARWLPGLRAIARTAGGFSPGRGGAPLVWGRERLGLSICFEIVFPGKAARQTRRGATALVTVTNDGWYGDSSAPYQHFRAARFRAAENRRPVFRAAITGISGVIAAGGSVDQRLGVGERGILAATVSGGHDLDDLTFFSRFPWLVPVLAWALVPFAIFRRRESTSQV